MKTLGNILWLILVGIGSAIGWAFIGIILACTVIGLPFARQCFKLARFTLWPFGRVAVADPTAPTMGKVGAVIWFIPGAFIALGYLMGGVFLCITIIGIPFGLQSFKFAGLSLFPFGKKIVLAKDVAAGTPVV